MTDITGKLIGLDEAIKTMVNAYPKDATRQRSLLNQAMSAAAKGTIVRQAKQMAMRGDSSGALSEAIGVRAQSRAKIRTRGVVAGVEVVPVRHNRKALSMYISYYYTRRGRVPKAKIVTSGIRHGHLVEFGSKKNSAHPFLLPSAKTQQHAYINRVGAELKRKTEAAVRRAALKNRRR